MIEPSQLVEQLKKVEHFKRLPQADLESVIGSGRIQQYPRGKSILVEGDPCAGMYVLLKGKVELTKTGPKGQVTILNTLVPVIMFNEVAVLDGGSNPVSASAVEDTLVWHINCESFRSLMKRFPQLALGLLVVMARRNRSMIAHYGDLSFRSVSARVAKHLLDLSASGTILINRKTNPIKIIAARVVTTPEAVSRTLRSLSAQGMIEVDRKSIRVVIPKDLKDLAEIDL